MTNSESLSNSLKRRILETDSIYARYNGAMLGYFLSGAPAYYAKSHYNILRKRMNHFLEEIGLLPIIPPKFSYEAQPQLMKEVIFMIRTNSEIIADFVYLSSVAFQSVILRGVDIETAEDCKNLALKWMAKYDIEPEILEHFSAAIIPKKQGRFSADAIHTAGLEFLRAILEPLRTDKHIAFVAMPFSSPFDEYFPKFYKPLLAELNYNAIRAWGGLSFENYQQIIGTLIRKSEVLLADLTTHNVNVIHEIGLAEGMGKTVFIIAAKDEKIIPSNLMDLAIVRYDRSKKNWEKQAILNSSALFSLGKLGSKIKIK